MLALKAVEELQSSCARCRGARVHGLRDLNLNQRLFASLSDTDSAPALGFPLVSRPEIRRCPGFAWAGTTGRFLLLDFTEKAEFGMRGHLAQG